jgi:excisionase family DNA binding protein
MELNTRAFEPHLTVGELADVMRVSKMTIYRLIHNGELPALRIGRSFRVPESAAVAYMQDALCDPPVGDHTSALDSA